MTGSAELTGTTAGGVGAGTAWSGDAALIMPEPWMQDAACTEADPDLFFPTKGEAPVADIARAICAGCPVADQCLTFAMDRNEQHGIWGGLTLKQRIQLRRRAS